MANEQDVFDGLKHVLMWSKKELPEKEKELETYANDTISEAKEVSTEAARLLQPKAKGTLSGQEWINHIRSEKENENLVIEDLEKYKKETDEIIEQLQILRNQIALAEEKLQAVRDL
jgi:uncharacterized coiled-coil DUF342 family protein